MTVGPANIDTGTGFTQCAYMGGAGGTAQAITATPTTPLGAYVANSLYIVTAAAANTGAGPTINISALGAKTIVKRAATALAANDIVVSMPMWLFYDGTNMILLNPVVN